MNITYYQVTGTPLWLGDYCYGSNFGFKQFMITGGILCSNKSLKTTFE